ncbi:hypothetical protein ACIPW5_06520 [Streptomyces sp. NPDC090077]|uniref:hypothetical protein n=1 Tax=Streptomyces sp. NPDC090077 TaxID=3365938 RepID=UPI003803D98B
MNTFLDYLTVLAVAALLLAPALHGALHERRVERQLRAARDRAAAPRQAAGPGRTGRRPGARSAAWRRDSVAH